MKVVVVDASGHVCPVPSLMLRRALNSNQSESVFVLVATDQMARIDVPHLMAEIGGEVRSIEDDQDTLKITVSRPVVPTS